MDKNELIGDAIAGRQIPCQENSFQSSKNACHPLTFCPTARIMKYKIWRGPDLLYARHKTKIEVLIMLFLSGLLLSVEIFGCRKKCFDILFSNEGFELHIAPAVCRAIVAQALEHETGARGLDNVLVQQLTDIAFNHFGQFYKGKVTLSMRKGHFNAEVRLSA